MSETKYFPRIVRPVPDPLGLYIRPEYRDQKALLEFLSSGNTSFSGFVFNPVYVEKQNELFEQVLNSEIDTILDPRTQESATPGGYTEKIGTLPWGVERPHRTDDFQGILGGRLITSIANFALEKRFTQIISPSHLLKNTDDPWLKIDIDMSIKLRNKLDILGGENIPLIYSLAIPYAVFRDHEQRMRLINLLKSSPVNMIWLKIDGLGSGNTATATCNYIRAAADFHSLGIPVVADHIGGIPGLALLAFGAVGALAHGITLRERFSAGGWKSLRQGKGRLPQRRIYIPEMDLMLDASQAKNIFNGSPRVKGLFSCKSRFCCPRGIKDMLENPAQHFLYQRINQVNSLSVIPEQLRSQRFYNKYLLPITDKVLKASNIEWQDKIMLKKTYAHRKRLDAIRIALGEYSNNVKIESYSLHPKTRVARK